MKSLKQYINESKADGKNGHYEDFADKKTDEHVCLWVDDPDTEELKQRKETRKDSFKTYLDKHDKEINLYKDLNIAELEDIVWDLQQELRDLHLKYRDINFANSEAAKEIHRLYSNGEKNKAVILSYKYDDELDENIKKQESIKKKIDVAYNKLNSARNKMFKLRDELWGIVR